MSEPIPPEGHHEPEDAGWSDARVRRALITVTGIDPRIVEIYIAKGISPRKAPRHRPSEEPGPYGWHVIPRS